jgi:3-dehydroquinate synthase
MSGSVIRVGLGERAYDIRIGSGLIDQAASLISPHLARPYTVIVTDATVDAAQGGRLAAALAAAGVKFDKIVLAPGEATKSFASLELVVEKLIALGVERRDAIIALGGGVIGDLAGFAAAILRRGCRFVQIPTTLLAQVDSSVGGKTAINAKGGKNLVGAFHQPSLVIADVNALSTLPAREIRAGYAEIVKYGALGDAAFFAWLEREGARVVAGDQTARIEAVTTSVAMKARIVAADEREEGERALLNLGHTFGHALEAAFGFSDRLLHGEAIAAGMGLAFDYSVMIGACAPAEAERLKRALGNAGLPAGVADIEGAPAIPAETLLSFMMQDKKVERGALTLILARRIGEAYIARNVEAASALAFLKAAARPVSA